MVMVTLVSLVLAVALGALLWRRLQEDRQRTDARVAALVEGFAQQPAYMPPPAQAPVRVEDLGDKDWLQEFPPAARAEEPRPAAASWSAAASETSRADTSPLGTWRTSRLETAEAKTEEIDLPLASDSARVLFGQVAAAERDESSARLMSLGVAAALLVGLVLAIWTVTHLVITVASPRAAAAAPVSANAGTHGAAGTAANAGTTTPATTGAPATSAGAAGASSGASESAGPAGAAAPLELLTLTPARTGATLTITGLVRNPSNGARQENLAAVVFFFNARGQLVSSVRAPLDFRALAPGDESPFRVRTPTPADVSRYRVSFRHDRSGVSGAFDASRDTPNDIVPHVDRRRTAAGS